MASTKEEFYRKLKSNFDHVQLYEDSMRQDAARREIPIAELEKQAESKAKKHGLGEDSLKDLVLIELLDWFKNSFFTWVDKPICDVCRSPTVSVGMTNPVAEEALYDASRVEKYECKSCKKTYRFPRYNDPSILLTTRSGRCGEWANCFTLCCRSLGYDARYVLDFTDHVWTEVFSDSQRRWLHCDPCENVCDKPLLYESGWGKKLTYVIAFSRDDIQDVTWRYSSKHAEVLSRRDIVPEPWLVSLIISLRNERQSALTPERQRYLGDRMVRELVDMMKIRTSSKEELVGRQTGSYEWRKLRGEIGSLQDDPSLRYIICPTEKELEQKLIEIKYSCRQDVYVRGDEKVSEWKSIVHECSGTMRKVEYDWNMVYLSREEDNDESATISWKVDLSSCGMTVHRVEVEVHSTTYNTGRVGWTLKGDEKVVELKSGERQVVTDFRDSGVLVLTATLSSEAGGWQHAQIFRQNRFPKDGEDLEWPLHLKIFLKN